MRNFGDKYALYLDWMVSIQSYTCVKTFTACKLYFSKPDYKISLISFLNDKWIIYTKGKLELLSGNIRKADFTHINRKRFKLSKKGNEVIDYRGYRNGPTLAVISD